MASPTLSIGSSGYQLLESLGTTVTRSGSGPTTIKAAAKGSSIDNLGLSNGSDNSNTSVFGSVNQLEANLGGGNDTLNIYGNAAGSRFELDSSTASNTSAPSDGNDSLSIAGNLVSGAGLLHTNRADGSTNDINRISTGGGNDTIRITGSADSAFIYLGDGNDSLTVTGAASNLDITAGAGNDALSFFSEATNVSVSTESGNDTVVFKKQLIGTDTGITFDNWLQASGDTLDATSLSFTNPSIDLGSGNDSLVLGGGTAGPVAINTGSGNDTIQLTGSFETTQFILDGRNESHAPTTGNDRISASPNASFANSSFISNNQGGDTLVFSNGTQFTSSNILLGSPSYGAAASLGNDSIVFGSNSSIINSSISLGGGADTLVFGSGTTFYDSTIDLGSDNSADRIILSADVDKSAVTIAGAGAGDTLYIGVTAYTYDTTLHNFYNGSTAWKS